MPISEAISLGKKSPSNQGKSCMDTGVLANNIVGVKLLNQPSLGTRYVSREGFKWSLSPAMDSSSHLSLPTQNTLWNRDVTEPSQLSVSETLTSRTHAYNKIVVVDTTEFTIGYYMTIDN